MKSQKKTLATPVITCHQEATRDLQNSLKQKPDKPEMKRGKDKKEKKEKPQAEDEAPASPNLKHEDDDADDYDDDAPRDDDSDNEDSCSGKNNHFGQAESSDEDLWTEKFTKKKEGTEPNTDQRDKELSEKASVDPNVLKSIPKNVAPLLGCYCSSVPMSVPAVVDSPEHQQHCELRSDLQLWVQLLLREQMLSMDTVIDCCSLEGWVSLLSIAGSVFLSRKIPKIFKHDR